MIFQVSVPAMAEDVEEIRILEWHGELGQAFAPGELLVEFETYKALVEVRTAQDGVLRRIFAPAGEWLRIGAAVALFSDAADEPLPEGADQLAAMAIEFLVD